MLRYREALGLLPELPGRGTAHRQFSEDDLTSVRLGLELERRYDVTPAALAFGLRVLADPAAAAAVRDLGERIGRLAPQPTAAELERERALRWLGRSGVLSSNDTRRYR
jgi:MerR family transcriptional regulator, copper efflux regulator